MVVLKSAWYTCAQISKKLITRILCGHITSIAESTIIKPFHAIQETPTWEVHFCSPQGHQKKQPWAKGIGYIQFLSQLKVSKARIRRSSGCHLMSLEWVSRNPLFSSPELSSVASHSLCKSSSLDVDAGSLHRAIGVHCECLLCDLSSLCCHSAVHQGPGCGAPHVHGNLLGTINIMDTLHRLL